MDGLIELSYLTTLVIDYFKCNFLISETIQQITMKRECLNEENGVFSSLVPNFPYVKNTSHPY